MGSEIAEWREWNVDDQLDWPLLDHDTHEGVRHLIGDLNRLYRSEGSLHAQDYNPEGFEWLDCQDGDRVILSFLRWAPGWEDFVVVVVNLTPVPRLDFALGVPRRGRYRVLLNTDAPVYGGTGVVVPPELETRRQTMHGRDQSDDA
jgi:1,4-alpha-glucan branching enzyme